MEFSRSAPILPAQVMYKNKLQEYAQKYGKPLPIYQTVNEGFDHAPKFRSTVLVNGSKYESMSTYPSRKQAEQEAAKHAYECICNKVEATECSLIYREPMLCKSILYEFAIKNNLNKPIYNTTYTEGPGLVFISNMALGGKTYRGEVAGSKKMAEQVAARTAIVSLLETDEGTLSQIIMSKEKCHPGIQTTKDTTTSNEKIMFKCSGNLPHQKACIEQAVVCFNPGGAAGNPGSAPKRKTETNGVANPGTGPKRKTITNNWARNNRRRF